MISAPLRRNPTAPGPARSSHDIITSITSSVNSLSEDFENEIRSKTDRLESVRAQLMVATRQLTTQRRQLESLKHDLDERALLELRLKKLRMAIAEEDGFDWTGRSDLDGRPARAGKLFEQNGIASTLAGLSASQIQLELEPDPFIPPENNQDSLVYLRRLEKWYVRVLSLLRERIGRMKGSNLEQEAKYLKVIGSFIGNTCTNDLSSSGSSMTGQPANQTTSTTQEVSSRATQNANPAGIHDLESMDGHRRKVSTIDAANKSHEFGRTQSELLKASMIDNKLLKQLMAAIESDGPELDLNRVAGFMQRVQSGSL
jgi:hypothetical protein